MVPGASSNLRENRFVCLVMATPGSKQLPKFLPTNFPPRTGIEARTNRYHRWPLSGDGRTKGAYRQDGRLRSRERPLMS